MKKVILDRQAVEDDELYHHSLRHSAENYYKGLGWIDVISSVIVLLICYWTGHLAITFSFVYLFWLAAGLGKGSAATRRWAIAAPIFLVITFAIGFLFPNLDLRLAPWGIRFDSRLALWIGSFHLLATILPALFLLGSRARRVFSV